jgi:hypothetical protein
MHNRPDRGGTGHQRFRRGRSGMATLVATLGGTDRGVGEYLVAGRLVLCRPAPARRGCRRTR